jgi:glyoxylase-like metal-dependent hydrolase (beta-lactamase superfamily II)
MAQNQLLALSKRAFYLPGAVNVGVVVTGDGTCVLIDSGADRDHGKKLLKACRAQGLTPQAIINTHSHADHYGGNGYLQAELQIPAYCPIFEESVLSYPLWEPIYLYGGVRPPKTLQNKWLLGEAGPSKILHEPGFKLIGGADLELIETSGHAHMMFSVICGDVLFASDAVFGPDILTKYPLPFGVDIKRQREAANRLLEVPNIGTVLPGHGQPTTDLVALVAANLAAFERASQAVYAACSEAATLPEVLARVCAMLDISMTDWTRYHLNQTTVLAYLTELLEMGKINGEVIENRLIWSQIA